MEPDQLFRVLVIERCSTVKYRKIVPPPLGQLSVTGPAGRRSSPGARPGVGYGTAPLGASAVAGSAQLRTGGKLALPRFNPSQRAHRKVGECRPGTSGSDPSPDPPESLQRPRESTRRAGANAKARETAWTRRLTPPPVNVPRGMNRGRPHTTRFLCRR